MIKKELQIKSDSPTINQNKSDQGMISIDIKNSPYAGSRKMNQLQRLFDANILRDWDESLLSIPIEPLLLEESSED